MNIHLAHYCSRKLNTHEYSWSAQRGRPWSKWSRKSTTIKYSDQKAIGRCSEGVAVKPNHLIPVISCENKSKSVLDIRGNKSLSTTLC